MRRHRGTGREISFPATSRRVMAKTISENAATLVLQGLTEIDRRAVRVVAEGAAAPCAKNERRVAERPGRG